MSRPRVFLLPCALLIACPAAVAADWQQQLGLAHAADGKALLYREQHLLRNENGRPRERLVLYRCPGGAAFARKRIDYAASTQAPDFQLDDHRSGYREGLRRSGARVELFFRAKAGAGERKALLAAAPAVADAGFDEFIRAHWTPLLAGRSLPLKFAVPARLRTMEFSVRRAGALKIGGEEAVLFRLRLEGLLGLVAPHIDVAYGAQSRRLLRFQGLGNLRNAHGNGQWDVRIDFPAPAKSADAAMWRAAAEEPLAARCESGQQADSSAVPTGMAAL